MASVHPISRESPESVALHDRAMDNLRYIRETMERAGSFTAISGWGVVAVGATALVAALFAANASTVAMWIAIWTVAAVVAMAIGAWSVARKARKAGLPLLSGPGRKMALSLSPALVAGAVLTTVLYGAQILQPLPGMWMLLYGAGMIAAGSYSVRIVPVMGLSFMLLGTAALLLPGSWGNAMMALSFGGLHLFFGFLIARRHGG